MIPQEEGRLISRIAQRVIRSRGERPQGGRDGLAEGSADYEAYIVTPGFPRMGFTLGTYLRSPKEFGVQSHGILYPDLKKLKWRQYDGAEYITFTHAGEAYTLRGRGLYEMYLAMMDGTLQSVLEYDASVFAPIDPSQPIIDRVAVTDVAEMVRRSREDRESRRTH
ncbi:hypothetical protein JANAI62_37390 [Jannaschia pagri]|uniref:SnoaL-like domain-containing protein n=1 Tax=Jannaschia pagri TaxID=2829797 RepID=A0ABQ4NRS2_9RHOB|nr:MULTISPECIES: hypothetical protein [unclassified Jannaschia]GIT93310.1 hypothetical protein JANAI61_37680 [Jannaschia sp. AI_61]GIT97116.1 hypothetical protein JANAI62_37390 [Jannaschia sp. AI_62]